MNYSPVKLEIFKHLFSAVADEMGTVLRKSSFSPNIKERRDFSCAVFNPHGAMVAQAAHIPVHLGAMPLSVRAVLEKFSGDMRPGDLIVLNNPFQGGTHLPDITMVTPVFHPGTNADKKRNTIIGFVASRAHHADVGGMTPGSMPLANEIFQEGLIIPPVKLVRAGRIEPDLLALILANVRTPDERQGDLQAQFAANQRGADRLTELVSRYGRTGVNEAMNQLLAYTERMTRHLLASLPDGVYRFTDALDNNGIDLEPVQISVAITIAGDKACVDFSGSAHQQKGSINAVEAITRSAVAYVFRCLLGLDVPNNAGCSIPIEVIAPPGSIVNAQWPAPVAGGNVETSQRIVDVLFGALAQACPDKVPAASQGTMNNLTIGGTIPGTNHDLPDSYVQQKNYAYYETIGGGAGARPGKNGISAIHSHMTNTLNTPIEALEYAYPLRVRRYEIRTGSGGIGQYTGGEGILREIEVLADCQITLLTDRRVLQPYGLEGGGAGGRGSNILIRNRVESELPGKGTCDLKAGDIISIRTPGGGGYGVK
jgi:N-methylhydantoinase B